MKKPPSSIRQYIGPSFPSTPLGKGEAYLPEIKESPFFFDLLEKIILRLFIGEIYWPLNEVTDKFTNSQGASDKLAEALESGKVLSPAD